MFLIYLIYIYQVLQNHFEESKTQHQQNLEKTEQNIKMQNRMIQKPLLKDKFFRSFYQTVVWEF